MVPEKNSKNLLKMIDIDGDLRLNILLNSRLRSGIAALVDHIGLIEDSTRLLYISYTDHEKQLPDNLIQEKLYMKSLISEEQATHIIIAATFGVDVAVVLKLTSDETKVRKVDDVLKKMQSRLNKSNDFSGFKIDDEDILKEIHEIKVYSNLSELSHKRSLREIFQYITESKNQPDKTYSPIMYTLQSVKYQPCDTEKPGSLYITLKEYEKDKLEQYLLEISNQMKKSKPFLEFIQKEPIL